MKQRVLVMGLLAVWVGACAANTLSEPEGLFVPAKPVLLPPDPVPEGPTYDLATAVNAALKNDAQLQQAAAQLHMGEMLLPLAQSGAYPQLTGNNTLTRTRNQEHDRTLSTGSLAALSGLANSSIYGATLTHPLFKMDTWIGIHKATDQVKAARATYMANLQNLYLRVAKAYFQALKAEDLLRTARSKQDALATELEQTLERYKVGLDTLTVVSSSQAEYQSASAEYLDAKNNVDVAIEQLSISTGMPMRKLARLKENIPLLPPIPTDIEQWMARAKKQNLMVLAAYYTMLASQKEVAVQRSRHLPTANLTGSFTHLHSRNGYTDVDILQNQFLGSLVISVPIFQGFYQQTSVKNARYAYYANQAAYEYALRNAITIARQDFLSVTSGILQIQAAKLAITSREHALKGMRAESQVGTKTTLDVLNAQKFLFQSRQAYWVNLYQYLEDLIQLKADVGELGADDIEQINRWLRV